MLCNVDPKVGKYLTASFIVRGKTVSPNEVGESMQKLKESNRKHFTEWIPDSVKYAICNVPSQGYQTSAAFVGMNLAIKEIFKKIGEDFC